MTLPCQRKAAPSTCVEPGDFAWSVALPPDGRGWERWRNPNPGERPTHIYLILPGKLPARLPVDPPEQDSGGWQWDGDLDKPTLTPSIDCSDGREQRWHGWLSKGVLTDA